MMGTVLQCQQCRQRVISAGVDRLLELLRMGTVLPTEPHVQNKTHTYCCMYLVTSCSISSNTAQHQSTHGTATVHTRHSTHGTASVHTRHSISSHTAQHQFTHGTASVHTRHSISSHTAQDQFTHGTASVHTRHSMMVPRTVKL